MLDGASTVATVPNYSMGQILGVATASLGLAAVGLYFYRKRGR